MTTVTRTLRAEVSDAAALARIGRATAFLRADLWRRLGALGTVGKSAADVRRQITAAGWYAGLDVDGTIRAETTKDVIHDILTYKAAAAARVRQSIARRGADVAERKRLDALLRQDRWLDDRYLHRQMRKRFRHGVSRAGNQFIVRSDKHHEAVVDGRLVVTVRIASLYGQALRLTTTSDGTHVDLRGKNLRIILRDDGQVDMHYATTKPAGRPCGTQELGVDKGYTEAFTTSDGAQHGAGFGTVLGAYSEQVSRTGQARNRLHALEKAHRDAGRVAKADRIRAHNLGRVKMDGRRTRTQQRLRTLAYQSAHQVVDKAALVVSEDLTSPIRGKVQWRRFNRRMSAWAKGVLAQALDEVCAQRGATHVVVNAAYTSQMDSVTGRLEGRRVGDKFYRANGDVMQADANAARNVLGRLHDREIGRWTPYTQVKRILLARSSGATERQEAPVGRLTPRQRSAEKSKGQM